MTDRDRSLDTLLELDGQVLVIDAAGYWVRFAALVADFWSEVEAVMREQGVWP